MLKRRDSPYLPGRPKGHWFKWKRDPFLVDAVLMYAQRGHGKRSSFYSDYTFGVWEAEERLVPVGKAYFGFTDEELVEIDRYVRRNTLNRFGPVREVTHGRDQGLVFEVAFEGHRPLEPAQIRRRHAVSAHFAPALGQAAARGGPARHADADDRRGGLGRQGRARALLEVPRRSCYASPRRIAMNGLERFLGGSVLGVIVRLIALSIAVGVVLAWLDITPWALVESFRRFVQRIFAHGFDAVRDLIGYFLLGAVIVVPLWIIVRLIKSVPAGRR